MHPKFVLNAVKIRYAVPGPVIEFQQEQQPTKGALLTLLGDRSDVLKRESRDTRVVEILV